MPEENLSSESAWNSLPVNWCIKKLGPIITEMGTKYVPQFSHTCHSIESLRHISGQTPLGNCLAELPLPRFLLHLHSALISIAPPSPAEKFCLCLFCAGMSGAMTDEMADTCCQTLPPIIRPSSYLRIEMLNNLQSSRSSKEAVRWLAKKDGNMSCNCCRGAARGWPELIQMTQGYQQGTKMQSTRFRRRC